MPEIVRVTVRREYDLTVEELFPDGLPDTAPGTGGAEWPVGWSDAHKAAYALTESFRRNPFAESSFLRDFMEQCARSTATAEAVLVLPPPEPEAS